MKRIYIFYFPVHFNNTTHELFRFKRRFEILKIAFAGHGTRYLRSPRSCFPSVCFRQTWTHILNSDDNLPINCLSSATRQCVQLVFVDVFSFRLYILSMNPSWVKSVFSKQPKEATLWRAQEVTFFVQWSGEGQKSVMSMSSDICNVYTHAWPDLWNFQTSGNGCFQSPSL